MGFIGFTSGLHAMKNSATGAAINGLSDGQAVIGDVLRVTAADATPSWRSPTPAPTDEVASGNLWSVSGSEDAPLYVVAGLEAFGPFTIRNRLDLAGWGLDLGAALSIGKVLDLGMTDVEIQLTIDGMDTPFSGTSHAITSGTGADIAVMQRNLPSNRVVLGVIAEAPELVVTKFPGVSGSQNAGETVTVDPDETLSWDSVAVTATTREARLVINGVPGATGELVLPLDAAGQDCDLQVRFSHMTAAGVPVMTDWITVPNASFTILDGFALNIEGLELVISGGPGVTTITVVAPPAYAGTYQVDAGDLTSGPVNIVPPVIIDDGTPALGETLSVRPGLWVYADNLTEPSTAYQWLSDGMPVSGAIGDSYTIQNTDEGAAIALRETTTDIYGARSAVSAAINLQNLVQELPFTDNFASDTSAAWSQMGGGADLLIADGVAGSDGSGNGAIWIGRDVVAGQDIRVRVTCETPGSRLGAVAKFTDIGNRVSASFRDGAFILEKRANGIYSNIQTPRGQSLSSRDIIELDVHAGGTLATLRTSVDGGTSWTTWLSDWDVSDVANSTGIGFRLTHPATIDTFFAEDA